MEMALENNTQNGERMSSPPKKTIDFSNKQVTVSTANEGYSQDVQDIEEEYIYYDGEVEEYEAFPNFNLAERPDDFYINDDFVFDRNDFGHREEFFDGYDPYYYDDPYDYDYDYRENEFPYWGNRYEEDTSQNSTDNTIVTTVETTQTQAPQTVRTESAITRNVTTPTPTESVDTPVTNAITQEPIQTQQAKQNDNVQNEITEVTQDSTATDTETSTILDTTISTTTIDTTSDTSTTTTLDTTTSTTDDTTITTETTTIGNSDTNSTRERKKPNDDDTPPEKPTEKNFSIEYEGNLARNTIYVNTDKNGDIKTISYQYFESSSDISLEQTVSSIISSGVMSGKVEIDDIKFRYNVFNEDNQEGYDIVFLDRAIEISTLNRLLLIFICIGTVGLIVLFGVSWMLASWAVTPIADAWDKQKQFIADASHELKTPLTVIATNTDVILANEDDTVRNQAKWLTYIKSETTRMSKLVSDLLYIAKSDVNEIAMVMSEFNLSNTLFGICLVFETVAFESNRILNYDVDDDIMYSGDEDRIKQLINILIDNAIKHSDEGAEIMVTLKRDTKDKIKLTVTNTKGEEIPAGMEDRLFERFFRVDKSRNHMNGSHGLGLNIAQSIVKNHNGSISVSSTVEHVVTFTVVL